MTDCTSVPPLISVIIPTFNAGERIAECLRSVLDQDYPADRVEILVVDGGSQDLTHRVVSEFKREYASIHWLDNPGRIVSTAMNIGIRRARGDVIVRVDAHCILEPDYLRQCVRYLEITGADNVGGLMRPMGKGYVGRAIALTMSSPLAVGDAKFRYATQMQEVDTVYMGVFSRDVFERVGVYNESLVRNQDYELNYRIRAHGGHIYLVPPLRSYYVTRPTLRAFWFQYFDYGFWKVQMLRRHPRSVRWRQLVSPFFVASLIITGVGGRLFRPLTLLFRLIAGAYMSLAGLFTLRTARRHGWRYLPILPITFASMHLSWGLGFLWGLVRRPAAFDRSTPMWYGKPRS